MKISGSKAACMILVVTGLILVASSFSAHWYHDWTEEYDAAGFATALAATGTIFGWIFFVSMFTKSRWGNVATRWLFLALIVISVYIAGGPPTTKWGSISPRASTSRSSARRSALPPCG